MRNYTISQLKKIASGNSRKSHNRRINHRFVTESSEERSYVRHGANALGITYDEFMNKFMGEIK